MGFLGRLPALTKVLGAAALRGGGGGVWRRSERPLPGSPLHCWAAAAPSLLTGCRAASSRALGEYEEVFRSSLAEPEKVWGAAAEQIHWYKPWDRALETGRPGGASW